MYYLAKWRISNAGQIILPGTVFEAECTEEEEKRLLSLGAIVRTDAPEPVQMIDDAAPELPPQNETGDEDDDTDEGDAQKEDGEKPEEVVQKATDDEDEEGQEDEDEADDEAPLPVIDVSEGIVEAPATQPEAAPVNKKNTGRGKK